MQASQARFAQGLEKRFDAAVIDGEEEVGGWGLKASFCHIDNSVAADRETFTRPLMFCHVDRMGDIHR